MTSATDIVGLGVHGRAAVQDVSADCTNFEQVSLFEAREIMGSNFFGPDEIKKLGLVNDLAQHSTVPFPAWRCRRAVVLGESLVLVPRTATMAQMAGVRGRKSAADKLMLKAGFLGGESFMEEQPSHDNWLFMKEAPILESLGKNPVDQLAAATAYLLDEVYTDHPLPPHGEVVDWLDELEKGTLRVKDFISQKKWDEAVKTFIAIHFNQRFRPTVRELVWSLMVRELTHGVDITNEYVTNTRSSKGGLVTVGLIARHITFRNSDLRDQEEDHIGAPFCEKVFI